MEYEQMLDEAYSKVSLQEQNLGRFEVPKVKGHYEGTKTIIINFILIVNKLRREPNHLMKFLNKELASASEISGERLIFSRKITSRMVNEKIERYANEFVICSKCKKPDTEILEESGKLTLKCLACGNKSGVHKL